MDSKLNNIKIVIWDMDETFWKGTLSEGKVYPIEENIKILNTLIDRGIMNSIVSKNEYLSVMNQLKEWSLDDLFIFPHITWAAKGGEVKALLKQCSLRAENALFIDDNISNLKEVEYYNPGIMTSLPEILDDKFLLLPETKGKDDRNHSRLQQYKILEQRTDIKKSFESNLDFLRFSNINIEIIDNCELYLERIEELIQRTNQLNYTKIRANKYEIEKIIKDQTYQCACIKVSDKFGEYGVVGFYAVCQKRLIHFVFSCRILGFGVENYIYRKLDYPEIAVSGEVTIALEKKYAESIDWISEKKTEQNSVLEEKTSNKKILMIGGCDLEQTYVYLKSTLSIDTEFNTIIRGHDIRSSDTSQLINSVYLSEKEKEELNTNIPFFDESITFATKAFDHLYDVVVISVVDDFIRGLWKHRTKNYYIGYGGYFNQDEMLKQFSEEQLYYLRENFEYCGRENTKLFEKNLKTIIELIGNNVQIIIINGIDIDVSEWIGRDRVLRNREMNEIVDKIVSEYANVKLLDMRRIVTQKSQLPKNDNRHFDRKSYYAIAQQIIEMANSFIGENRISSKRIGQVYLSDCYKKGMQFLTRLKRHICRKIKG